jgi:ParB-like chromosome segregation protein Spo0J
VFSSAIAKARRSAAKARVDHREALMELELQQLDLRYQDLRRRSPVGERQLLASLAEIGQQMPIVVVGNGSAGFVLIDGYKRVRVLRRLARDCVRCILWEVEEAEALLLDRMMRCAGEDTFEQAWLLAELQQRFTLSLEDLARRFDRSKSWISRRLALLRELPAVIQEQVRCGALTAHAAMKYLVPLARANAESAKRLATALVPLKPSTRQVGALYAGWQSGTTRTRELIESSPQIYLRAQQETAAATKASPPSPLQRLLDELGALAGIARRARHRLEARLYSRLLAVERQEVDRLLVSTRAEINALFNRFDMEGGHVG